MGKYLHSLNLYIFFSLHLCSNFRYPATLYIMKLFQNLLLGSMVFLYSFTSMVLYHEQISALLSNDETKHNIQKAFIRRIFRVNNADREMVPIYYINLDSSMDRRDDLVQDFSVLSKDLSSSLSLHRVPAVTVEDVKQMLKAQQFLLNNNVTLLIPENKQLPYVYKFPEAACTLSHLKAIKQAYDDVKDISIIIEDDALLSEEFARHWREFVAIAPSDWSILQLSTNNENVNR